MMAFGGARRQSGAVGLTSTPSQVWIVPTMRARPREKNSNGRSIRSSHDNAYRVRGGTSVLARRAPIDIDLLDASLGRAVVEQIR